MNSLKAPLLFSPGPTPLSEETLKILSQPPLHHRSTAFKKIVKESLEHLSLLFDDGKRLVLPSTGSGALEAATVNFLNSKTEVLTLDGGKFGERWAKILRAYGVSHKTYKFDWGTCPKKEKLCDFLSSMKPQALVTQACETSTASCYDLNEISNCIHKVSPETLFIVDGVTAVGAYPLSMKKLKIDVLLAGSQKALGLPAGLSFVGFSEKAEKRMEQSDLPKFYFDLKNEIKANQKDSTFFSSPTQLWLALRAELLKLKTAGLESKFSEIQSLQSKILNWAKENRIKIYSQAPSPSLTSLEMPASISAQKIQKKLIEKGYFVAVGQDEIKDKVLRIGHMANVTEHELDKLLKVLLETLKEEGF